MTSFFSNSNPNCGIKGFSLTSDQKGTPIDAFYTKFIKLNANTGEFEILNKINKAKNYKFFIQAESSGGEFSYKKMRLRVVDNKAPYFKGYKDAKSSNQKRLPTVKIAIDPTDLGDKIMKIKFPRAFDTEKDKIEYKFTYQKQKWIKQLSKQGNKYVLKIDKTKIKASDAGNIRIGVQLKDDKYSVTRLENSYILPISITYKEPVVVKNKTESTSKADTAAGNATDTVAAAGNKTSTAADATADTAAGNATDADTTAAADSNATDAAAADTTAAADDTTAATASTDTATDKAATATTAADATTDKTATQKEKPRKVKSGGQLAG